jgi:hypothetical protein
MAVRGPTDRRDTVCLKLQKQPASVGPEQEDAHNALTSAVQDGHWTDTGVQNRHDSALALFLQDQLAPRTSTQQENEQMALVVEHSQLHTRRPEAHNGLTTQGEHVDYPSSKANPYDSNPNQDSEFSQCGPSEIGLTRDTAAKEKLGLLFKPTRVIFSPSMWVQEQRRGHTHADGGRIQQPLMRRPASVGTSSNRREYSANGGAHLGRKERPNSGPAGLVRPQTAYA